MATLVVKIVVPVLSLMTLVMMIGTNGGNYASQDFEVPVDDYPLKGCVYNKTDSSVRRRTIDSPPIATSTIPPPQSTSLTETPVPPFPWQWIHPLKTASSFANALYMMACPEEYSSNWTQSELVGHSVFPGTGIQSASNECKQKWRDGEGYNWDDWRQPRRTLRKNWWLGEHAYRNQSLNDQQIFITLRDPIDRIISQFSYQKVWKVKSVTSPAELAAKILQNRDLDSPFYAQHMTSLLAPLPRSRPLRAANSATKKQQAEAACKVVQKAAWVGFVDDYERSLCLLHAKFDFPRHPAELTNSRPTTTRNTKVNSTVVGNLIRNQFEILDDIVYKCARERFERELHEIAPHCI